jgi:hypothetical protein
VPNAGLALIDAPTYTEKSEAGSSGGFWHWLGSFYKREPKLDFAHF